MPRSFLFLVRFLISSPEGVRAAEKDEAVGPVDVAFLPATAQRPKRGRA